MTTCAWGIANGFGDTLGHWHNTPADTRQSILRAMGVDDPHAVPTGPEPVHVVRCGHGVHWPRPGTLRLEDGTELPIHGQLPPDLPIGYHRFHGPDGQPETWVLVSPGRCPMPDRSTWGFAAQLYAARSQPSWGIGDLADLARMGRWTSQLGGAWVMINPLAATTPALPQEPSPYYPCSRRFLNPIYLRIEDVPGATALGAELAPIAAAGRALNAERRIDRDAVFLLKQRALRRLWEVFPGDARFEQYCRDRGDELDHFATYCALVETQGPDWRTWPAEYHDCNGPAVQAFHRAHAAQIAYHKWLQWLLERQMAEAANACKLIQDLPVGVDPGGADAWAWQAFLTKDCTVGAPPDLFNAQGQDWQVPAFVPHKLRAAGYQPFVDTLRCVLRHAGGLRIDHVMGLFRLFWIPKDFGAARGAYVRYRPDELLAVVDIESHRAGAFIVGEDLGTIEHGMREKLAEHAILSFRVMWFESHSPEHYPPLAMAAATTHDLATVAGLWDGSDLAEQKALGFHADEAMLGLRRNLQHLIGLSDGAANADVVEKTYQLLGRSPCRLLVATLDDALAVPDRPNLPGTVKERMNWSLALPGGLDALEAAELPGRIARALHRSEKGSELFSQHENTG